MPYAKCCGKPRVSSSVLPQKPCHAQAPGAEGCRRAAAVPRDDCHCANHSFIPCVADSLSCSRTAVWPRACALLQQKSPPLPPPPPPLLRSPRRLARPPSAGTAAHQCRSVSERQAGQPQQQCVAVHSRITRSSMRKETAGHLHDELRGLQKPLGAVLKARRLP